MDDGGSAFPFEYDVGSTGFNAGKIAHTGMSLRDYFAAHAPEGVPLHYTGPPNPEAKDYEKAIELWAHHHTKVAYAWADAMLEARDKQPSTEA